MPRYKLRTLLIVLALGPPLIAGIVLMPPEIALGLLDFATFAAFAGVLMVLWIGWPKLTKWL